ncbi:alkanesulfonate monooxygenase SsuD/methylene tetrahydromethanopterin reductase-like flavin-dependent oxidoreductase (luciferase family) [Saccharothrix carnea]|uniref:Alkanesulfonate monooxygenase SsuD/methylene tetrahydromethanopterin reductase-like flavin-dependent oxidoreductase (Luciferase family) n=1 Tax=Saccharothrix carnea TaxID=1280637 RepID=A0A2P8I2L7_SACCR|nr:LLM class flavin-dependent oxidoreductase [Saccharothrix carnea]PSL52685.1 alkanesulfonate monooxygenase SsuD/methylene tetrahydromethanopterin reductase-like flavin-dependent oxidoreductase (luciferase family) [Saccharothrix carnea]
MKFGVVFFPTVGPEDKPAHQYFDECLRLVDLAEELGYDHVKMVEHYFFAYGGYSPDPVTFLAAAAGRTKRLRLGTSATIPAFVHPVKLAGKLAMLDNISHGRVDAAFGRAFLPDEFKAFGIPMDESRDRFVEGVEAVKLLWTTEDAEWKGTFHEFGPVTLLPRPVQRPHPPVFVTSARSVDSVVAAARAGHHLQTVPNAMTVDELRERVTVFRREWAAAGHDRPGQIHLTFPCVVAEDEGEAIARGRLDEERNTVAISQAVRAWQDTTSTAYPGYEKLADIGKRDLFDQKLADDKLLIGTPDQVAAQLRSIADLYGDDLTLSLGIHSGHLPVEQAETTLRLLADRVIPHLRREP